jgi:hypothetical protein
MNKQHTKRWLAAKGLFEALIKTAKSESAILLWDNELLPLEAIQIRENEGIFVCVNRITYTIFQCDPDLDEGLFTPVKVFEKSVRDGFKLVKLIKY